MSKITVVDLKSSKTAFPHRNFEKSDQKLETNNQKNNQPLLPRTFPRPGDPK
jgi:hypothetical protein